MRRKGAPEEIGPRAKTNRLLDLLPPGEASRIHAKLDLVTPKLREVVFEDGEPIRYVYFPAGSIVSLLALMENGEAVEVGTIGNEGMAGLPLLLGARSSPGRAFQQVVGPAYRMRAQDFLEEVGRRERFSEILHLYMQYFFIQVAQGTACNRLHPTEERCARWLLQTRDRVDADEFPLTHEFLAQMLGVRRATVTVTAGTLQKAGLIEYQRGIVRVLDAAALEAAACECYRKIGDEYERLFGGGAAEAVSRSRRTPGSRRRPDH